MRSNGNKLEQKSMAEIAASMVMELRGRTGLGMMECKKALTETAGDIAKAEELLRIKSGAKASKAADRVAAEGVSVDHWPVENRGYRAAALEIDSFHDTSCQ
jgi:translation elongation factor EF-Ts